MKILITGGTGQVGFELQRSMQLHGECLAPTRQELDLHDASAVDQYLDQYQPDLIINAAAYTAVDLAVTEVDQAYRVNAELPKQLANYCQRNQCSLIHYSSDYVYPGTDTKPWTEESPVEPQNAYGQSKLAGDQAVVYSGCEYVIFRTSWVYSARGHNFMKTMLKLGKDREELSIVNDQIGAPTPARLIAHITALSVALGQSAHVSATEDDIKKNHFTLPVGLYHLAPRGETSWLGFAEQIFKQAKDNGLQLAVSNVKGIPTADYPTPASRPLNSRLSVTKLENALNIQLPYWQSQLALTLKEHLS